MRLIFYYGNFDKTTVKDRFSDSSDINIGRLTQQNRKFLQSLGLTVIRNYIKK